jgi:hypothetical protein
MNPVAAWASSAMAKNPPKRWIWSPARPPKVAVPAALKAEVEAKAKALIETVLKPEHVKPPPKDPKWNYLTDTGSKWRQLLSFPTFLNC